MIWYDLDTTSIHTSIRIQIKIEVIFTPYRFRFRSNFHHSWGRLFFGLHLILFEIFDDLNFFQFGPFFYLDFLFDLDFYSDLDFLIWTSFFYSDYNSSRTHFEQEDFYDIYFSHETWIGFNLDLSTFKKNFVSNLET